MLALSSNSSAGRFLIAWDIRTSKRCASGEFPCDAHHVSIIKDKVVIIDFETKQPYPIYIWDLGLDRFLTIGSFSNLRLWHVDLDENRLVAFEIGSSRDQLEVEQTKWALNGEPLGKKHFHLSVPNYDSKEIHSQLPIFNADLDNSSILTFGHKTVLPMEYVGKAAMDLIYDNSIGKLSIRLNNSDQPDFANDLYVFRTPDVIYYWQRLHGRLERSLTPKPRSRQNTRSNWILENSLVVSWDRWPLESKGKA